ncbi:hypothetical protein K8I31_06590 [bacterium]|nr:hypothetical protein [bacterium]
MSMTKLNEFIQSALRLTPEWELKRVSVNETSKRIQIEIQFALDELLNQFECDPPKTMRYLPVFDYQTFISAPVVWRIENGRRTKRMKYPWENNIPDGLNNSTIF